MRLRALFTAGTTAVLLGVLPMAALAQDTSNDPNDLDSTFVPSAPSGATEDSAPAPGGTTTTGNADATDTGATDELPNTGGGFALAGGAAVAGAALLRSRRH